MNDAHVDAIWERTLATLRHDNTVSQRVIALLMLSRLMAVVADTALVAAPSTSAKELFEHRIAASLTSALSEATGREIRRSEEHTSELQSRGHLVCRLLLQE